MAVNLYLIAIPTFPTKSLFLCKTHFHSNLSSFKSQLSPISPISIDISHRRRRSVVTRAVPNNNTLVLAFVLPLSLVLLTVFAALRVSNKLDQQYIEEVLRSEALKVEDDDDDEDYGEDDDDDDDDDEEDYEIELPLNQRLTPTRTRPKREV